MLPPELVFAHPGFLRPCHRDCTCRTTSICTFTRRTWPAGPTAVGVVLADRTQAPFGGRLRGRESDRHLADAAATTFTIAACSGWRRFSSSLRETLQGAGGAPSRQSAHRAAQPGPTSPDLFRRRVSGPLPGLHAGRRGRSDGPRQSRLPENARRTATGRRHSPPRARRRLRSAGVARRFAQRCSGPCCRRCRSGNVAVANALGSGLLEAPALMAFCPRCAAASPRRGSASCLRWRPGGAASRRSLSLRARQHRAAGDQAGVHVAGGATDFRRAA